MQLKAGREVAEFIRIAWFKRYMSHSVWFSQQVLGKDGEILASICMCLEVKSADFFCQQDENCCV